MHSRLSSQFRSPAVVANQASIYTTTYYVDSVAGDDLNNGTSSATPWQSLTKASNTVPANSLVRLKCGSSWRDKLRIAGANVRVETYDSGAAPIIDGADIIAPGDWVSQAPGAANVWGCTRIAVNTAACVYSIFENGIRLIRTASLAACQAQAGSFFTPAEASYVQGVAFTAYVHTTAGTDPASNGNTYEIQQRDYCMYIGGEAAPNARVYGPIVCKRAAHHNGVAQVGRNSFAHRLALYAGGVHNLYIDCGTLIGCDSYDCEYGYDFVGNKGSSTDGEVQFIGCRADLSAQTAVIAGPGYFCHGDTMEDVRFINCISNNHQTGFAVGYAFGTITADRCIVNCPSTTTLVKSFYFENNDGTAYTADITNCRAECAGYFYYGFENQATAVVNIENCAQLQTGTTEPCIRSRLGTLNVTNCSLVGVVGSAYGAVYLDSGAINFNHNIIDGLTNPVQTLASATYVGDDNVIDGGTGFRNLGTFYANYALWTAATGQDAGSASADPLWKKSPPANRFFGLQPASPAISRTAGCTAQVP
jgi:hypothetical protein